MLRSITAERAASATHVKLLKAKRMATVLLRRFLINLVVYASQLKDCRFRTNTQGCVKAAPGEADTCLKVNLCTFEQHIDRWVEVSQEAHHGACLKEDPAFH